MAKHFGKRFTHNVMFLCNHNSCRSVMAEGWLLSLRGNLPIGVASAGVKGGTGVRAEAVAVMHEKGVDLGALGLSSAHVDSFDAAGFDTVVSMCGCGGELTGNLAAWKERSLFADWALDDPPALDTGDLAVYRRVRDECKGRVQELLNAISADLHK